MLPQQDVGPLGCWLGGPLYLSSDSWQDLHRKRRGLLLRPLCAQEEGISSSFWEVTPGGSFRTPGGQAACSFPSLEWNQRPPLSGWKFVSVETASSFLFINRLGLHFTWKPYYYYYYFNLSKQDSHFKEERSQDAHDPEPNAMYLPPPPNKWLAILQETRAP